MSARVAAAPSFAKINIGLNILQKRSDGYHNLETIFQQVDIADTIQLAVDDAPKSRITVSTTEKTLPVDESNLAYRAAVAFLEKAGLKKKINIHIKKKIPIGAGLGGGSGNAATVLLLLQKLTNTLTPENLMAIGTKLGADVPFFIEGGCSYATGIGDELTPIRICRNFHVFIVVPSNRISTKWAYDNYRIHLTKCQNSVKLSSFITNAENDSRWRDIVRNDFEPLIFSKFSEMKAIKEKMYSAGAFYASISGSGSAVYGLFCDKEMAFKCGELFRFCDSAFLASPVQWGFKEVAAALALEG